MISFLIDPHILTLPSDTAEKITVEEWVDALEAWLIEATNSPYKWFHSTKCTYNLINNQKFPMFEDFRRYGINSKRIISITQKLNQFFRDKNNDEESIIGDIENKFDALGHLAIHKTIEILPNEFIFRQILEENKKRIGELLTTATACKFHQHSFGIGLNIATLKLTSVSTHLDIEVEIETIDPNIQLPTDKIIREKFPLIFSPTDLPSEQAERLDKINNGKDLWDNIHEFFPSLDFCDSVGNALKGLLNGNQLVGSIKKRLLELERVACTRTRGSFDFSQVSGEPRKESESTMNNAEYASKRTFVCPDGQTRTFEWHCSLPQNAWRLHFYPYQTTTESKIIIGYIGPHLPTTKYN
ncbi:MAG: hypothetical protein HXX08_02110 [Chloroflexi bacterium]|uniref:Uncharacterized protein n=1 Tax=Candidatus Chlorohelix allophototropha TaxID=3003348 RepID=A0A8T7LZ48_9CHLR|nr:hypothetical protein [Chloroflexota bacterium]WJW66539.1 hypothetical protein OZ401_002342 [Chloroflexota bacterium L227-S17]